MRNARPFRQGLSLLVPRLLAVGLVLLAVACTHSAEKAAESYRAKMKLVVEEAIRQAPDAPDKAALREGEIFVDIKGLKSDQQVVGISVPADKNGHHIHIVFMADHFQSTSVVTLASEVVHDLATGREER
jgi:hypothetical protein